MVKKTRVLGCMVLLLASCSDSAGLESAESVVGAAGGLVELPNGTKVEVPAGALPADVLIRLTEIPARDLPPPPSGVVHGRVPVAFTPHGTVFVNDVKITLPHSGSMDRKVVVRLADENDGVWKVVPNSTDEGDGLSVHVRKFSVYSVLEGPQPLIPGPSFEGATPTQAMAVGDLDGDGDGDVITGHDGANFLWVNDGTGALTGSAIAGSGGNTTALRLKDPLGFGFMSGLYVGQTGAQDEVWVNDPMAPPLFTDVGQRVPDLGPGTDTVWVDLAYDTNLGDYQILTITASGAPVVYAAVDGLLDTTPATGFPTFVGAALIGDLTDNLELPDMLLGTPSATANPVWGNDGSMSFYDLGSPLGSASVSALAAGDVDGDGDLDIWVGTDGNAPDQLWIFDSGQITWTNSGQQLGTHTTTAVAMGDLDGDGDVDAFVGTDGPDFVYWNDGSGGFTVGPLGYGEAQTRAVFLEDMDGDLDLDVVVQNGDAPHQIWLQD